MIVGIILRNFKTYQAINYIPISGGRMFSALVGENGVGKSSVLEALDCFFNGADWNLNHSLAKGFSEREPFVCPVFLLPKDLISEGDIFFNFAKSVSEICWKVNVQEFNLANKSHATLFCKHREILENEGFCNEHYYLVPIGLKKNSKHAQPDFFFSFFEGVRQFPDLSSDEQNRHSITQLHNFITNYYKYIYLPSDIDFGEYMKIHGKTTQALLGQKLETIVRDIVKKKSVDEINSKLNGFLDKLSDRLGGYQYKKPAKKQNLVNQSHLTEKIIEAYFESKVLHKIGEKESLVTPVGDLSSGEKRQALIDVAKAFLLANPETYSQQVVLAIDEPELSLHVSACFGQFEKLRDISSNGVQVIITTHWYGFMPIISEGVAVYCPKTEDPPLMLDLRCFREDIKRIKAATRGALPVELELKGINDLVQSIIASITGSDYRWLICEGSSDKIYLDHYLADEKLLIVPVGGAVTVKKIYSYLYLALDDSRGDIQGRVYCLLDTDRKFESYDAKESIREIVIRRIKNSEDRLSVDLLKTSDTAASPPTFIEDVLDARFFVDTLKKFSKDPVYGDLVKNIGEELVIENDGWPSALAMNLKFTERKALDSLFSADGFKVKFAMEYARISDRSRRPAWIEEIADFLARPKATPKRRARSRN